MTSLRGIVTSGLGQGAHFVSLPWVRDVIRRMTGIEAYPGTLNIRLVDPSMLSAWRRIRQAPGLRVAPPAPEQCGARLIPLVIAPDVAAAVIVPDVTRHGDEMLELVAGVHVRSLLGLRDDDPVTLQIP